MSKKSANRPRVNLRNDLQNAISMTYNNTYSALEPRPSDGIYVEDGATLRRIEALYNVGESRAQLAIRMNLETEAIAVCHLVAASSFPTGYHAYLRWKGHRVFAKASRLERSTSWSFTMISIQRHNPSTRHWRLPTILVSKSVDSSQWITYYTRSRLTKEGGRDVNFDDWLIHLLRDAYETRSLNYAMSTKPEVSRQRDSASRKTASPITALPLEIMDMILDELFHLSFRFCPIGGQRTRLHSVHRIHREWAKSLSQKVTHIGPAWNEALEQYFAGRQIKDEFILASAKGDIKTIRSFLNDQRDVNLGLQVRVQGYRSRFKHDIDWSKNQPMHVCRDCREDWRKDDMRVMKELKDDIIYQRARQGQTALMTAAAGGHRDIVQLLLSVDNINLNQLDYAGCSALTYARYGSDTVRQILWMKAGKDTVEQGFWRYRRGMIRNEARD